MPISSASFWAARMIVRTLADAISLHARKPSRIRLVTLDGEIVEADGAVIVGPKAIVTGLISRKSELLMLAREIEEIERSLAGVGTDLETCRTG